MTGIGFFLGITFATFFASALFFLKFWRASRDRFYAFFAAACAILASEAVVLFFVRDALFSVRTPATESSSWVFVFRLAAFLLILWAIIDKNRKRPG